MDKMKLLNFVRSSFNTNEVLNSIKQFPQFKQWNIINHDTIGDRGLILHVKTPLFVGCILIVFDGETFYIRKVNKSGFVLLTNKTNYVTIFGIIFDLYLVD
jgi:hypothetical protein